MALPNRVSSHHGCSQSTTTLALTGHATLTLDEGRASLVVDYVSDDQSDLILHAKSLYLAPGKPLQLTKRQPPVWGWSEPFEVSWRR